MSGVLTYSTAYEPLTSRFKLLPSGLRTQLWATESLRAGELQDRRHLITRDQLTPIVGDLETVPDEHGRLLRDRRDRFLTEFTASVNAETADLADTLPALRASLQATEDKQERAAIREQISQGIARLAYLRALHPFTVGSECTVTSSR